MSREAEHEKRRLQLEAELEGMSRARKRDNVRMAAGIVISLLIAIPMMAMSAHVSNEELGRGWLYSGLLIGDLGVLGSVVWGFKRAVDRGDAQW